MQGVGRFRADCFVGFGEPGYPQRVGLEIMRLLRARFHFVGLSAYSDTASEFLTGRLRSHDKDDGYD